MDDDGISKICSCVESALADEREAACSALMAELKNRHERVVGVLMEQLKESNGGLKVDSIVIAPTIEPAVKVADEPKEQADAESNPFDTNKTFDSQDTSMSNPSVKRKSSASMLGVSTPKEADHIIHHLVHDVRFESFIMFFIFVSIATIAIDVQIKGLDNGYKLSYGSITSSPEITMTGLRDAIVVMDYMVGIVFVVEIVLKLIGDKLNFFKSLTNWLDVTIVMVWLLETAGGAAIGDFSPFLLRIVRLFRVLRLLKLARQVEHLDSLFILVESIKASKSVLIWSSLLLFFIQMGLALFLNQALDWYWTDVDLALPAAEQAERRAVFGLFGTFTYAMVTMSELTFGNFIPVCRKLQGISEWYAILIIVYKVMVGFAVLRIVSGIFMAETLRVTSQNDQIMVMQKKRKQKETRQKMTKLFQAADETGDGHVSLEEFLTLFEDDTVKTWLSAQDLDIGRPEKFFRELAGDDDTITADEMIKGVGRLKGGARAMDMVHLLKDHDHLMRDHTVMANTVREINDKLTKLAGTFGSTWM